MISQALQRAGPGHVELRRIEAAKDIAGIHYLLTISYNGKI